MDPVYEVALIEDLDADVRRLLERCDDLMRAGDDRPLLTMVGRQLRDRLREVAELSGSLAALVSNDRGGESRAAARRPGGTSRRPAPEAAALTREPRGSAALPRAAGQTGGEGAPLALEKAAVVRLKPRMPRGTWRGRGAGGVPRRHPAESDAPSSESDGEADEAPVEVAAREPVYRLRKARGSEATPADPVARIGGDALDRLADFFKR